MRTTMKFVALALQIALVAPSSLFAAAMQDDSCNQPMGQQVCEKFEKAEDLDSAQNFKLFFDLFVGHGQTCQKGWVGKASAEPDALLGAKNDPRHKDAADCRSWSRALVQAATSCTKAGFSEAEFSVISYKSACPASKECVYSTSPFESAGIDLKFVGNAFAPSDADPKFPGARFDAAVFDNHYVVFAYGSLWDPSAGGHTKIECSNGDKECAMSKFAELHPAETPCVWQEDKKAYICTETNTEISPIICMNEEEKTKIMGSLTDRAAASRIEFGGKIMNKFQFYGVVDMPIQIDGWSAYLVRSSGSSFRASSSTIFSSTEATLDRVNGVLDKEIRLLRAQQRD